MKSTIQEIFLENIQSSSDTGITFIDERNSLSHLSYKKLYLQACYKLNALQEKGLNPGDELIFQFESNRNFVITFWACVLGKIIPVPVAFTAAANTVQKISRIWGKLNNPYIITDSPFLKENFKNFQNQETVFEEMLERFLEYDELKNLKKARPLPVEESDIVFIQFSSGSTSAPKGVINTQEAILYNYKDYLENIQISSDDRFLGWVPLTHDMGVIFFHLVPLLSNSPQYLMSPALFVTYPELWIEKMSEYKITISGSPNFGFRSVLDNLDRIALKNISLESMRLLINSAEPVSIDDCKRFNAAFTDQGLSEDCIKAAYGLADAVLGVSMNYKNGREDKEYLLNRSKLNIGDEVEIVENKTSNITSFANLGTYGFTQIRIVDENGKNLPDRALGYIWLKSKAVTKGYYNDPETTRDAISEDGWLNTGDIGFIDDKDLVMTGRAKEMIIVNGQNYFLNDLDNVLSEISEIAFQQAISCDVFDAKTSQDEIFVFILYKYAIENFSALVSKIKQNISHQLGIQVSKVIPVDKIPKTTSGKIQRYLLKERYLNGDYNQLLKELDLVEEDINTDIYTPPTTEIECSLAQIWQEYFDIKKVGIDANFYFLGGNSIGMGKLAMKIEEEFSISIDIRMFFTCVEFRDQVKLIENAMANPFFEIEKAPVRSNYPLFTTQKRLFALYQSDPQSLAYNTTISMALKGSLDIELCEDVFRKIIRRHEILRTSFDFFDGKPRQQIHNDFDFEIEIIDDGDSQELIKKHIQPFDLNSPPLLRVLVCKEGDVYTKIILDVHHIVADGASFEVLIAEFSLLYAKESIAPLKFQFKDFIEWNERKVNRLDLDTQKEFWMNQYAEPVEPINLPIDIHNEEKKKIDGDTVIFDLNDKDQKKLKELCKKQKVTMSTMTLTIFNILLSKLANKEDIVVGTSSLGRWDREFKDLIGLFIDTLPIRSNPSRDLAFSEFLQKVKINVLECLKNGEYSFEKLYNDLKLNKNANSNSLFNIAFEYYNFNWSNIELSDLHLFNADQVNLVSKFPLALRIIEKEEECEFYLDYSLNSFSRETVERFGNYYQKIVKTILEDNTVLLKDIQILSETDINQQLHIFNNTSAVYEKDKTLTEVFLSQVKNNPDKIALVFEEESLTYKELDKRSTQLARYIKKKDNTISSLIGLCLDRSIDMIIGILGVLKSGRGYVPIDASYPTSRIAHIIRDSNLELVVTKGTSLESFKNIEKVLLDRDKDIIDKESTRKISAKTNSNDLAYVIYTSGSTGIPKGVLVNHQNVIKLVKETGPLSVTSTDRVLQWANVAFDGSVFDIFCSLLNGATLYLIDKKSASDVKSLSAIIKNNEISISFLTTSLFNVFVDTEIDGLLSLNKVIIGGEKLSLRHVQKAYDVLGPGKMINGYGPTETTVFAIYYSVDERPIYNVPIGKPLENTKAYVLDSSDKLCGLGIVGELHIGGDGVTMGYLNDEEKTNAKFIDNPYETETYLYKTGDLVKWLPNGNLEFIGRKDNQVKLRGFRIELSEIEFQLDTINEVQGSVVLTKEIEEKKHLVAYYKSKKAIENSVIRESLSDNLPDYMIPSFFVHLQEFPLTSNGKVNRKVLPEPTLIKEEGYLAPNNEIEHKLVAIWAEVLNIDAEVISVNGSFFNYGGDSLSVIFLSNKVNKEFAVKISPRDIIANPTIDYIQDFISKSSKIDYVSIPVSEIRTHYPLSSSQKRMYYLYEYNKDSIEYNVPTVATLNGVLDREKLRSALNQLIKRHESLRTVFEFLDGDLVQRILPEVQFSIKTIEREESVQRILESFVKPFNLSESPILRVGLTCISDTEHILIIDTHHIISDGITNSILIKELFSLYNEENLPELRIQYKDFAIWEQGAEHQKEIAEQKEYWLNRFSKETTTLELPYDYPRSKKFNIVGKNHTVELDRNYADGLKNIAQSEGVTMYTVFLALYNILLHKLTNQRDIVIGTPVSGRSHIDLETITGVFINTLAVRNNLEGNITFREFLQEVQRNNLADLENQLYPYEDLVESLNMERVSGRNPLFDLVLGYQPIKDTSFSKNLELQVKLFEDLFSQAKFDLIFTILDFNDRLKLNFTYREELFKPDTIARFMSYLGNIIDQVLLDNTILIEDIDILSQEEVDQQLIGFNRTDLEYEKDKTIIELFSSQVKNYPNKVALVFEDEKLTYKELDQRSTKLARYINKRDVNQSSLIGVCLDRSIEMIVGILGILKSGRGYVPIDASYPVNRITYMIEDADLNVILTNKGILNSFEKLEQIFLDDEIDLIDKESVSSLFPEIRLNDVAYVIYTSGSTGKPKGVLANQQNVVKLVQEKAAIEVLPDDRVLQWSNITSDGSVFDVFCSLLNGASLYLINKKTATNVETLSEVIKDNKITVALFTQTFFNIFVDTKVEGLLPLRKLLFGGEKASLKHVQKVYDILGAGRLINCYGPTEATVYATYHAIDERPVFSVPIGKPATNTKAYVLNSSMRLSGIGSIGELYIGGDGLTLGYLNDIEKTNAKFIDNPYDAGSSLYKTGDLVKWLPDGNLDFIGRKDNHVKLRGFRIELSEIELQLNTHSQISNCIVVVKETDGAKQLISYYQSEQALQDSDLREYAHSRLPNYMVPSHYVYMKNFPLTSIGKINKKALLEFEIGKEKEYREPRNKTESKLVRIWSEILNLTPEKIGVNSNFFELGGASLRMVFLINNIKKEFGVELSLKEILINPTIEYLCKLIQESDTITYSAIPIAKDRTYYPLSSTQKRMYYEYEYDRDSIAYNAPIILTVKGALDLHKLEEAFTKLIERHESLRTIFEFVKGDLMQKILQEVKFSLKILKKGENPNTTIRNFIKPFDLSKPPIMRAGVIRIEENEHILVIDCHHIVSDGVSTYILLNDLIALYEGKRLVEPKIQYKDYIIWQLSDDHREVIDKHKEYWVNEFDEWPAPLELPFDYSKSESTKKTGRQVRLFLDRKKTKQLETLAKEEKTTVFILLLTIYNLFLAKLSNQEEIVIGSSVSGRSHADLEGVVGAFINLLVLRNYPKGEKSFRDFLKEVSQQTVEAYEHQEYAYEDLITVLKNVHPDRGPLFNVMFEYFKLGQLEIDNTDLSIEKYNYNYDVTKFDFTLRVSELESGLEINLEYCTDLFKKSSIERFKTYFEKLIDEVLLNPDTEIKYVNMLPEAEIELLTNEFNDTIVSFDKGVSLVAKMEKNVALHPNRLAVSYEGKYLTYKELDEKSNQVANFLISEGELPNVVGLLIERSIDMIVGIWGVLKVGAGYLPLDPNLPEQRIRYMLDQSGATFLLTHEHNLEAYSAYLPVQSIDASKIRSQSIERITFKTEPSDLAYCIFTSGSTGKPKGVMVNHSNVINLVKGLEERVYKPYKDRVLRVALLASYAFDASVQQIFGALLQGHSLYITDDDTRKDGTKLKSFFNDNNIDVSDGTPTHLRILVDSENTIGELKSLSSWLLAGEVLSKDLISSFYQRFGEKTQLYNFYGPTEACVDSTSFKIDPKQINKLRSIPIGKPLPNERVYVTDGNGELVPVGAIGELCIAGDGVAQRYVGDQSLTTEKFTTEWISQERRVYRTGDMVRWLPDGNLEFHGRKDNQVKIRGYRIELGEVEKQLNTHPDIKHSVIRVKESENEKYLVAYYQASDKMEISELRDYLGKYLPDYMIPSYYVYVEQFGLTVNGKVDYKALPDYKIVREDQDVIAPSNDMERKLVAIYAQVLNIDSASIGSNGNFMELGGHSLKMVYLANGIKKELAVKVSIKQIMENPTVNKLSNLISESVTINHSQIPLAESMEYYPLSSSQKRMFFAHEYDKESLSYNVPNTVTLKGILDKEKLEESFVKLINRHDSLRTVFVLLNGELFQRILPEVDFSISYLNNDKDLDSIIKNFIKPFDLSKAPLLRVGIIKVSSQEHVMIMDCHHIISDEVTSSIILRDFSTIYNGENPPELRVQYKDFVIWQNQEPQQEEIKKHKEYWLDKFSNQVPILELPCDYPRSVRNTDHGGNLLIKLDQTKVQQLKEIASSEGLTLYNLFLSMYNILLYKLSNQKDIVVGTPVAGRPHDDLESITGVFINTLPIRNQIQGDMTFKEFVQQVQKGSASDLDHQLCPYEDLVDELNLERDLNRNPLFDVSFNFIKQDLDIMNLSGLVIEPYTVKYNQSKFDLNMIIAEREEDNYILIEYARQLFKESTVERFMRYFDSIMETVCENKTVKIADIEILEEKESQLLNSFGPVVTSQKEQNTIVNTFERQVIATPLATAIKFGDLTYTYDDLNQKVNQLARSLQREYDITRGDIIGVLLPKSDAAIVSILAILKLGAAYLPIDTNYPAERVNYIIKNSGLKALITEDQSCSEKITLDCKINYETVTFSQEKTNLDVAITSDDLAYVIYTSGSTGKPKGVMIAHGSNVNMSTDIVKQLNVNDRDTVLWFASIGFDASVYEIMMALYSGATLVIPEDGVINDTNRFCALLSESRTTIVTLPPSYLETLPLEKLTSLRIITTAGESANTKKAIEVIKSGIRYFNAYGPTECAVCVSTYEVFRDDEDLINIPIGKPIANTEMVILDNDLKQVPIGVKGTIYVAGKGVARGYLNNPVLTEKSFITLPSDDTKKYYNTGDLGEWTSNGLIIFHGRKDNQIKLRGYRIELGEIEGTLSSIDYVRNCHVTLREGPSGERELIGFVILDVALDNESIEQDLGKLLPEYMIPKSWMKLDEFPLTINGKIDTKKLFQLEVKGTDDYVAPSNDVEKLLVQIWSEILNKDKEKISVLVDFFDLGGNSLIAIQLITTINKNYGIQLELQEVFKLKTIRALSELIDLDLWVNDNDQKEVEYSETVI